MLMTGVVRFFLYTMVEGAAMSFGAGLGEYFAYRAAQHLKKRKRRAVRRKRPA